jgi:CMP-N-acetylneuraminic acid synthetase
MRWLIIFTIVSKNIAIIPARGGSKRLPGKNIRLLNGKPLIAYSIEYALIHKNLIHEVIVSTDDVDIKKIAIEYGAKVIDRPASISGDFEPTVSALTHTLEQIGQGIDFVVLLQATNPFRPANLLSTCIKELQSRTDCDSCFTVTRSEHKLGNIKNGKFIPFNYQFGQRSQDMEPLYFENGLLYITHADAIRKSQIITDNHCCVEVNHVFSTIDIDTEQDFLMAESLIKLIGNE